jgi:hypothetical protein
MLERYYNLDAVTDAAGLYQGLLRIYSYLPDSSFDQARCNSPVIMLENESIRGLKFDLAWGPVDPPAPPTMDASLRFAQISAAP